jgi:DNA-directed RNA polymerase subunit RPC12/RpoP
MSSDKKHVCPTCSQETGEEGHMCTPVEKEDEQCEWCGALILTHRHMCKQKLQKVAYICNSCGRTAVSAEHLCQPVKIE